MQNRINRQVRLKSRPVGIPEAEHFEIIDVSIPEIKDGQILIRNIYLSVDPAMRGWVNAAANYQDPVPIGAVMRSHAVGKVVDSRHPDYQNGDIVYGMFGWQDYALVDASAITRKITETGVPISTALGILGLNGVTAYFGLLEIGKPKAGETVAVSAASGSVGSCVGQIAKIKGCRTVGITDGQVKVQQCLNEFGYDAAVDYTAGDLDSALKTACPEGVDVYFDTTSGTISDTVMKHIRVGARIVICGTIAIQSWEPIPLGPRIERYLLINRARIEGFIYSDFISRSPEALQNLSKWIRSGLLHYREDILEGIEQAPASIAGLYRGKNLGKRIIRITEE